MKMADIKRNGGRPRLAALVVFLLVASCVPLTAAEERSHGSGHSTASPPERVAWATLTAGMRNRKPADRVETVAALSSIGDPAAILAIEHGLADKNAQVRAQAATSLGQMNALSSIPKLKGLLQHDRSAQVVFAAAKALSQMRDSSSEAVLIEILLRERQAGTPSSWRDLVRPKSLAMMAAGQGAGMLLGPFAWGLVPVQAVAGDGSAPARAESAELLGNSSPSPRVARVLERALKDHNWTVRAAAAEALGNLSAPSCIPALEVMIKDHKPAVRYLAAASIIRISLGPRFHQKRRTNNSETRPGN